MSTNDLSRRFPIALDKTMVQYEGEPIKQSNMPYYLNQHKSKRHLKVEDKIKVMCEEITSNEDLIRKRVS